eukprot:1156785-Pelagomonas_calceolata.AAC.9
MSNQHGITGLGRHFFLKSSNWRDGGHYASCTAYLAQDRLCKAAWKSRGANAGKSCAYKHLSSRNNGVMTTGKAAAGITGACP